MGNPVVTRLGLNQFWYSHWYSKTNYSLFYKQSKLIVQFLKIYLSYGVTFTNNFYLHQYFFNNISKKYSKNNVIKFYRQFFFSNSILGIEHSYFLRYKTDEFFPGKLWFVNYSNWVIIYFQCFKPQKKNLRKKKNFKKEIFSLSTAFTYSSKSSFKKRFTLLYKFLVKSFSNKLIYSF
jgi:hypothetical protein